MNTRSINRGRRTTLLESAVQRWQQVRRRKNFISNPEGQFKLIRQFTFVLAAACGLTLCNVFVLKALLDDSGETNSALRAPDWMEQALVYGYGAVSILLSIGLIYCLCIILSHRLGGPVSKLGAGLMLMADGDLTVNIKLRDEDFLQDLAKDLNTAARSWRFSITTIEDNMREIKVKSKDPRITSEIAAIDRELQRFRTTNVR